jgi:xanthine dehydrogenase accessory factor
MNVLHALINLERQPKKAVLCTVVSSKGSTPQKAGAKMLVISNEHEGSHSIGTIGGGAIEHHIHMQALEALKLNEPRLVTTSLRNDLAMCCGGEMTVFIEPIQTQARFLCFGAGHIAQSLCPLIYNLGFAVFVYDSREDLLAHPAFNNATKSLSLSTFDFSLMPWSAHSFALVTTHDHQIDQEIIENILQQELEFKYLALVGSLRKALMTKKRLSAKNISTDLINKIICPAGLAINAKTPQEIALSIAAQIIQVYHAPTKTMYDYSSRRPKHSYGISQSLDAHRR